MMRPLAVIGNVNVDLIMGPVAPWPQTGTEVMVPHDELRVGGAAGNAALAWKSLSVQFQAAANIGSDPFGQWLANAFPDHAPHWSISPRRTTLSVGLTHPDGERTFFTTDGHLRDLAVEGVIGSLDASLLRGGVLLLCGTFVTDLLTAGYEALFDWADRNDIDIALDTGWPSGGWSDEVRRATLGWLSRSSVALFNEVEATGLTRTTNVAAAAKALREAMPSGAVVVVKQGAAGAMALGADGQTHAVPAQPIRVFDTIGAGNIFNAGFLAAFARGLSIPACLSGGCSIAATAISTHPRRFTATEQDLPK